MSRLLEHTCVSRDSCESTSRSLRFFFFGVWWDLLADTPNMLMLICEPADKDSHVLKILRNHSQCPTINQNKVQTLCPLILVFFFSQLSCFILWTDDFQEHFNFQKNLFLDSLPPKKEIDIFNQHSSGAAAPWCPRLEALFFLKNRFNWVIFLVCYQNSQMQRFSAGHFSWDFLMIWVLDLLSIEVTNKVVSGWTYLTPKRWSFGCVG